MRHSSLSVAFILIGMASLLAACQPSDDTPSEEAASEIQSLEAAAPQEETPTEEGKDTPMTEAITELSAVMKTNKGDIHLTLYADKTPITVANFVNLAQRGYYDGLTFHRVIPGFAIQGGCPNGNGTGVREDGKLIPAEFHDAEFKPGTLAMAHKSDDPNSASCQFFIVLDRLPELNGRYTVIGQASDDETLRALQQIAAVATDENDRPVRSLLIRSISLIDRDGPFAARRSIGRK